MRQSKLEAIIKQGKWPFVFSRGVLAGGLFIPASNALFDLIVDNEPFLENFYSGLRFSPFLGFIAGLIMWGSVNRQYKAKEPNPKQEPNA